MLPVRPSIPVECALPRCQWVTVRLLSKLLNAPLIGDGVIPPRTCADALCDRGAHFSAHGFPFPQIESLCQAGTAIGPKLASVCETTSTMGHKNDLIGLLNLHDLLVDSRKGYSEASGCAEDARTKELLASFGSERVQLEAEADTHLTKLDPGAEHRNGGTIKGHLHRTWMDPRDPLTKRGNSNVLSECERGDEYPTMRYDEVLKQDDLSVDTRTLAAGQRTKVRTNLRRVKELRKQFEAIEK